MNKRVQRKLDVFRRIQQARPQYNFTYYTPHEQAIREHIQRGFKAGLTRVPGLLNQANKIS